MGIDWLSFLKIMVIEEQAAREKYQIALDSAKDPQIRAMFEKLRDEEAFHAIILEGEYTRIEQALNK